MKLKDVSSRVSDNSLVLMKGERELERLPIIQASDQHRSLILSTWVKSYQSASRDKMNLTKEIYLANEPKVAEAHWQKALVVTSPDDNYAVYAWVCGWPGALLHVYVSPELRNCGIARALMELASGKEAQIARLWPGKYRPQGFKWTFNPYLLQKSSPD